MKKILSFAATLLSGALCAQMTYFTTPNYKFNTAGATPVGSALISGGTQGTYDVANGCYDNNDNLLFYVTKNGVYNTSGTNVGILGYPGYTNVWCSSCNGGLGTYINTYYSQFASTEFEIVPVPGACKVYYVIYNMQVPPSLNKGCYIKVDCSSGSPVVIYNGTITAPGQSSASAAWEFVSQAAGYNIGYAVSNIISGSGSSAIRYLYTSTSGGIKYFSISNTGISGGTTMACSISGVSYLTTELELSPDGNWLAWVSAPASGNNSAFICRLNATKTAFVTGQQWAAATTGATFKGLEFSKPVQGVTYLYLAGSNGLSYVNTNTQSQPVSFSSGTLDLSNTFLEMGKNGKIYGVSKTSSLQLLAGIDPANSNALSSVSASFDSRYMISNSLWANGIYTLPSQIDGQNYNDFNGNPNVSVTSIDINGSNGACGWEPTYYSCNPIVMNAVINGGTPTQYKIDVSYSDGDCDNYYGPGAMNYSGAWTNGAVPANIDVRTFTDGNGLNLNNIQPLGTNNYKVTLWVKDGCGNISWSTSVFHLFSAVNASVNLEIYNTYYTGPSNTYLPAASTIGAAIPTGALTAGFRINNSSTGNVTGYNVKIDQVNSAGTVIKNIYNQTTATSNITTVGPQSLNSLCIDAAVWSPTIPGGGGCSTTNPAYTGYTGYFGYMNGNLSVPNYYLLTVSINNLCSQSSASSYIYVNNGYARPAVTTGLEENSSSDFSSRVYPNPSEGTVHFSINSQAADTYSIELYDIMGRKVATVVEKGALNVGETKTDFNTTSLPAGIYTYKITTAQQNKSGLLSIDK